MKNKLMNEINLYPYFSWKSLFSWKGSIGVSEFWRILFDICFSVIISKIMFEIMFGNSLNYILGIFQLLALYLLICAIIKRLNDLDMSGFYIFLLVIPFFNKNLLSRLFLNESNTKH